MSVVSLSSSDVIHWIELANSVDPIAAACATDNPYFAVTRFPHWNDSDQSSVSAFDDRPTEDISTNWGEHISLASRTETGPVYGLAYDWRRGDLYAGAYYKCGMAAGPSGLGAIYRIHLPTRSVHTWTTLEAGPANFDAGKCDENLVGKVGLADLELDSDAMRLFAVNLFDRQVHVFSVPDGKPQVAFPIGSAGSQWEQNGRPFGLGVRGGWVYHGVVDSREDLSMPGELSGHVYRSRWEGSELHEATTFGLSYTREPVWNPWRHQQQYDITKSSQPIISDIEFRPDGDLVLGLRDRQMDLIPIGDILNGDVLPTRRVDDVSTWEVVTNQEVYDDRVIPFEWAEPVEEAFGGALAAIPHRDGVVTTSLLKYRSGGVVWLDNETGTIGGPANGVEYLFGEDLGGGDIEALCAARFEVFLPVVTRSNCLTRRPIEVALILDVSTSMMRPARSGRQKHEAATIAATRLLSTLNLEPGSMNLPDRAAIIGFNKDSWIEQSFTSNYAMLTDAIGTLADRRAEGTRLDLAMLQGADLLRNPSGNPGAVRAVILLTDGLPNGVPRGSDGSQESTVLSASTQVKSLGAEVFTIGLGELEDVNGTLLEQMATDPTYYYYTHDGDDLEEIYERIGTKLTCHAHTSQQR